MSPSHPHPHHKPLIWLITATTSPLGTAIARHALQAGGCVIACVDDVELLQPTPPTRHGKEEGEYKGDGDGDWEKDEDGERREAFRSFWAEVQGNERWRGRCRGVRVDGRCEGSFFPFVF